jgi:hypothetical protein
MNPVEESLQVKINHPLVPLFQVALRLGDGRMTAASRAKAVATSVERRLVMRAEHLVHRLLHDPVDHVRYPQPSSSSRFGYPHAADVSRSVRPRQQLPTQLGQHPWQVPAHCLDALPVWAWRAVVRCDSLECLHQACFVRYLLHRHHRGQGRSLRGSRLRHRARRRGGPTRIRSAVGPWRAVGCLAKQSELLCLLAGRGRLPSPLLGCGWDRLSPAFRYYATIRLLSSLCHVDGAGPSLRLAPSGSS